MLSSQSPSFVGRKLLPAVDHFQTRLKHHLMISFSSSFPINPQFPQKVFRFCQLEDLIVNVQSFSSFLQITSTPLHFYSNLTPNERAVRNLSFGVIFRFNSDGGNPVGLCPKSISFLQFGL